jgi:hypothetical protein
VPYDSRTELLGIVARHADDCPVRTGGTCRCGPLGYRGGVWDWQASMWVLGPVRRTAADARELQREAHRLAENALGPTAADTSADRGSDDVDPSEQLWWWAFCYVGLGIFGVALALSIAGLGS